MVRATYLETAAVALGVLRLPSIADHWVVSSVLPEFQVSGLAGHLARQVLQVDRLVSEPPAVGEPVRLLDHFRRSAWTTADPVSSDIHAQVRQRGEHTAANGPSDVVNQVDEALTRLRAVLPAEPEDRVVELKGAWCITLDDYLRTRLLELIVHTDDLCVSVEAPTPTFPSLAVETTVTLLGRLAVWRHGGLPVIRALTRRERAPESIAAF